MAFPEKFISDLTDRNDIVEVVSEYTRLGKRSGSNMFGLCPFHSEKTPSFSVKPDEQFYYCFGCHKGGGVINFIMEVENLSYPEAVEFLARRAGMQMPEETDSFESRRRKKLLDMNRDAARFFYEQLHTDAGGAAREYIQRREISPAVAKRFGLGAAPDSWSALRDALRSKGYDERDMFEAGLVKKGKNGGFYDTFRNRLMFPVIDVRGNVIGFSGRILGDGEPKYLNSPDTPVFAKGRNLFALNLAKKSKSGYIILSEGNIDVVSMHQAGFDSAVASLGTALTAEQARLISRYTDRVIIAYDNDSAGLNASQKAISIFEKLDVRISVLRMSGAKDPDEFIKLRGKEAFRKLIDASENQTDYQLRSIQDKYDLSSDEQKVEFLHEAGELIARLPDALKRQVYAMRIAATTGLREDVVTDDVERRRKKLLRGASKTEQRQQTQPEKQMQPSERSLRYDDPESAAAEEGLIRLLYLEPELIRTPSLPEAESFSSPALGKIYSELCAKLRRGDAVSLDSLAESMPKEEMSLLVSVIQKPEVLSRSEQSIRDYIAKIRDRHEYRAEATDLRALANKFRQTKGYEG